MALGGSLILFTLVSCLDPWYYFFWWGYTWTLYWHVLWGCFSRCVIKLLSLTPQQVLVDHAGLFSGSQFEYFVFVEKNHFGRNHIYTFGHSNRKKLIALFEVWCIFYFVHYYHMLWSLLPVILVGLHITPALTCFLGLLQ